MPGAGGQRRVPQARPVSPWTQTLAQWLEARSVRRVGAAARTSARGGKYPEQRGGPQAGAENAKANSKLGGGRSSKLPGTRCPAPASAPAPDAGD